MNPINLTPEEVAERLRTSVHVLSNMRRKGTGPKFIKQERKVLYPLAHLVAWENERLRSNTAE